MIKITAKLIDCRPFTEYCAGHIRGACSLPATQLFERMHELPKKQQSLCLCGKADDIRLAEHWLLDRGHHIVERIIWNSDMEQRLSAEGLLESGATSVRLWQATPLWQRFVNELMPKHEIQAGKGLDIACGAGRDMVYLALQGWKMTGVDRSEDSLARAAGLAEQSKVQIHTILRDLETGSDPFADFESASFDLVSVGRYLHRPLFPAVRRLLRPGGFVMYQTFMQGCEKTPIGRPRNPAFLLRSGELAGEFNQANGFKVILDETETLDDGRPVAAFVARAT